MACPSCQYILEEPVAACPKCSFSGTIAVQKFPFPAPPLTTVVDPNELLTKAEVTSIQKKAQKIRVRLPQVRFVNCIVPLTDEVNLREFGFWLLNAGEIKGGQKAKDFAVLLLIDPKSQSLSVSVGYGLDPLVTDTAWVKICEDCRDLFFRQKYGEAIERFLDESLKYLSEQALILRKEMKK